MREGGVSGDEWRDSRWLAGRGTSLTDKSRFLFLFRVPTCVLLCPRISPRLPRRVKYIRVPK